MLNTMTRQAIIPPGLARGPFTRGSAVGLATPDDLRGPSYQRLLRGVYAPSGPVTHRERILAARQILPAGAVLAGASALWAHGVHLADPEAPAEFVLPPGTKVRNREHVRVRRDLLAPGEVVNLDLGPTTTPARTVFDLARAGVPYDVVPLIDALVAATSVRREQIEAVAAAHPGARWLRRIPPALDLVDAGAESVRESQLRLLIVEAGLPRPTTRFTILTPKNEFVARVDLAWPRYRVVVEYDGAYHDEKNQIVRDRARLNAIRQAGWTVLVVDAAQFARPDAMLGLIRSVLVTAGWHG